MESRRELDSRRFVDRWIERMEGSIFGVTLFEDWREGGGGGCIFGASIDDNARQSWRIDRVF